jgi:hypothetical protein
MERTFSVDDLIGNVYRLSGALGGMGNRTDSEAAFQEFLKRIPSATNLSAVGSAGGAQYEPGALQQTAQQLLGGTNLPTAPLNTSLNQDPAPSMPRVPSLDLLRQLVLQNSMGNSLSQPSASAALKPDALSAGEHKRCGDVPFRMGGGPGVSLEADLSSLLLFLTLLHAQVRWQPQYRQCRCRWHLRWIQAAIQPWACPTSQLLQQQLQTQPCWAWGLPQLQPCSCGLPQQLVLCSRV